MARPPAVYVETWNAEVDQLDSGLDDASGSSFDFAHFQGDEQDVRRLRQHGQQLASRAEAEDAQLADCLASLESQMRSHLCLADNRQQDIAERLARLEKLRQLKEADEAVIDRFQRDNASLRARLTTYQEDDEEQAAMVEQMRRAKREEEERVRLQRSKLQQALDIAQGVGSPSVAQLRNRFDSPESTGSPSVAQLRNRFDSPEPTRKQGAMQQPTTTRRNGRGVPRTNPMYRRSQSASRAIDHRPAVPIPGRDVFRPRAPPTSRTTVAPKADLLRDSDGYSDDTVGTRRIHRSPKKTFRF